MSSYSHATLAVIATTATVVMGGGGYLYYQQQQKQFNEERWKHQQDSVPLVVHNGNDSSAVEYTAATTVTTIQPWSRKREVLILAPSFLVHPITGIHYHFINSETRVKQIKIPAVAIINLDRNNIMTLRVLLQLKGLSLIALMNQKGNPEYHVYQDQISNTKVDHDHHHTNDLNSFRMIHFIKAEQKSSVLIDTKTNFYIYLQYQGHIASTIDIHSMVYIDESSVFWDQDVDEISTELSNVHAGSYEVNQTTQLLPFLGMTETSSTTFADYYRYPNKNIIRVIDYRGVQNTGFSYTVIQRPVNQFRNRYGLAMIRANLSAHQLFTMFYPYWNHEYSSIVIHRHLFIDDRHRLNTDQSTLYYLNITSQKLQSMTALIEHVPSSAILSVFPIIKPSSHTQFILTCFLINWEPLTNPNCPKTYVLMLCQNHAISSFLTSSVSPSDRYYIYGQVTSPTHPIYETMSMQLDKKTHTYQIDMYDFDKTVPRFNVIAS